MTITHKHTNTKTTTTTKTKTTTKTTTTAAAALHTKGFLTKDKAKEQQNTITRSVTNDR